MTAGAPQVAATEIPSTAGDAVELSPAARSADELARAQRVQEIRRQIDAGAYLTEDKVNATVQLLHDALFASGRDAPSQRVAG